MLGYQAVLSHNAFPSAFKEVRGAVWMTVLTITSCADFEFVSTWKDGKPVGITKVSRSSISTASPANWPLPNPCSHTALGEGR